MASTGSVLPPDYDIRVCVCGEEGVGKTSWIQAFVQQAFPPDGTAPRVLDAQQLRSPMRAVHARHALARTLASYNITLLDTDARSIAPSGSDASALRSYVTSASPDVIILCYACNDASSLSRAISRWLPAINAASNANPHWPYIPTILCGLKADADVSGMDMAPWGACVSACVAATTDVGGCTAMTPQDEEEVAAAIASGDVHTLRVMMCERAFMAFACVQEAINISAAHPTDDASVLGEVGTLINKAAQTVMYPIWPLYESYKDRLCAHFEAACIRMFRVCDVNHDHMLSLTEFAGFQQQAYGLRLLSQEIAHTYNLMREDAPESFSEDGAHMNESGFMTLFRSFILKGDRASVWAALHAFGYRLGVRPQSSVDAEEVASTSASSPAFGEYGLYLHVDERYTHLRTRGADSTFQLAGSASVDTRICVLDDLIRNGGVGIRFIAQLFKSYSAPPHSVLTPDDMSEMFVATPSQAHPFGNMFPHNVEHNIHGHIGLASWIHAWQMLCVTRPAAAALALFELGFSVRESGTMDLCVDPRVCFEESPPHKPHSTSYLPIRHAYVCGSEGAGKTSVILHYIMGGSTHLARYVDGCGGALPQTPAVTHYVACVPHTHTGEDATATSASDSTPCTLVITEVPEGDTARVCTDARDMDVCVCVVDPSSPHSVQFFIETIETLPDDTPVVVVCTHHASRGEAASAGKRLMDALCGKDARVAIDADTRTACEATGLTKALAAVQPSASGYNLEIFVFSPTAGAFRTQDLFKYVATVSAFPERDNPLTTGRRSREMWARVRSRAVVGGIATVLVCAGIAYAVHEPTRNYVHTVLGRVREAGAKAYSLLTGSEKL